MIGSYDTPVHTPPTEDDLTYIASHLGRDSSGVTILAVAARDAQGRPAVITNHPLRRQGERHLPFPTLYWLVDPARCKRVADLERDGAIGELERTIAESPALQASFHADHRAYATARWSLLSPFEQQQAVDAGYAPTLRDKGIGGIADFDRIKCLHLHLAHHLAQPGGTTIGRLIEARL